MGYAVFSHDAAGTPVVEDVDSLEAAVATVERLRNEDETADVRVFKEVPLQVRTYYKVVVADEADGAVGATPVGAGTDDPVAEDETAEVPAVTDGEVGDLHHVWPAAEDVPDDPEVASVTDLPAPPVEPLPGAFPLAATPVPVVEVHDADLDTSGEPARRHSLFGRGG